VYPTALDFEWNSCFRDIVAGAFCIVVVDVVAVTNDVSFSSYFQNGPNTIELNERCIAQRIYDELHTRLAGSRNYIYIYIYALERSH
jgi:hypothetical protein